jgi:exodeoxyribonuclease V gamma subunit
MALNLFTSNRMEVLVDALGTVFESRRLHSPFDKEVIVVQSRGMQRWLSMELAARFGVWANGHYPFPNALVSELFERLGLDHPDSSSFSKEVMTWKIIRLLPELVDIGVFTPLRTYLADDRDGLKCFQLAAKIADTFDQYTLFRPDLLAGWEGKPDADLMEWQAVLWRKLVAEAAGKHRGRLKDEFCRKLGTVRHSSALFPERISLFGVSYLPQFYLDMLSAVAKIIDVNLFFLSPTREYWGDIVSKRALVKMPDSERSLRTEGNPLLASLGTVGRDFSEMVLDLSEEAVVQEEPYYEPGEETLLHALQSDIFTLSGTGEDGVLRELDPGDRSVQVHSCHSPMREIEVLHDNLLFMLDTFPALTPRDILVMMTDVETYSPYISTVFGRADEGVPVLPYSIADRKFMNEGGVALSVMKLLDLQGSRMTAPELFDLLSMPPVSRRFQLDDEGLDAIRGWIEGTRIRWGMDESDRIERELPPYSENSWRAGLDRLLLGYAMQDEGVLFDGILPYDEMEGSVVEHLGKFAEFVDWVDKLIKEIDRSRTLALWQDFFLAMLDGFILVDVGSERELTAIYGVVNRIAQIAGDARFEGEVYPAVMLSWLRSNLEEEEHGLGFMTGGITFCSMLPMRSIPFRVVAMVGMNDGAFPRQDRSPGFDLIAREPRRGDRSKRSEDRYLFLETILSARDVFYISYLGQSIRDNSEIPPSVLVSELLDAVGRGFLIPDNGTPEEHLVVRHRLQAFHPAYFTESDTRLFSYSRENSRALAVTASAKSRVRSFIDAPISQPPEELRTVPIERLLRFYDNPAAYFLTERLGIRFGASVTPLEEREPFSVEGLDGYFMKQELLEVELQDGDAEKLLPLFRSRGILPPSQHGERVFRMMLDEVRKFARVVMEKTGCDNPLAPLDTELQLGGFRLTGRLDRLTTTCRVQVRCATMKPKDQIRSWITHLVLNAAAPEGYPSETLLVMLDKSKRYSALDNAALHLERLLRYYWEGLAEPLPFFPKASLAWAGKYGEESEKRLNAALGVWADGYNTAGEGADPAIERCFGAEPPFNERFSTIADELLLPMIEHGGKA